jgi:hypothetical protein
MIHMSVGKTNIKGKFYSKETFLMTASFGERRGRVGLILLSLVLFILSGCERAKHEERSENVSVKHSALRETTSTDSSLESSPLGYEEENSTQLDKIIRGKINRVGVSPWFLTFPRIFSGCSVSPAPCASGSPIRSFPQDVPFQAAWLTSRLSPLSDSSPMPRMVGLSGCPPRQKPVKEIVIK